MVLTTKDGPVFEAEFFAGPKNGESKTGPWPNNKKAAGFPTAMPCVFVRVSLPLLYRIGRKA